MTCGNCPDEFRFLINVLRRAQRDATVRVESKRTAGRHAATDVSRMDARDEEWTHQPGKDARTEAV